EQVDLADRQVIRGPPVGIHLPQIIRGQRACLGRLVAIAGLPFRASACGCHESSLAIMWNSLVALLSGHHALWCHKIQLARFAATLAWAYFSSLRASA